MKTPREILEKWIGKKDAATRISRLLPSVISAMEEYAASVEQDSGKWISVKDKLPLDDVRVIVCGFQEKGDNEILTFYNTATHSAYGWSDSEGIFESEIVLFWMPLPNPPIK